MATVKYGISRGEAYFDVTQAAGSAVTDEAELTVEDSLTKEEIVLLIRKLEEWITREDSN
jgi:hypothetical protein